MQSGHACQLSGHKFGCPDNCHLVLVAVKNHDELLKVLDYLGFKGIENVIFFEPDINENTAICTKPLYEEKSILKRYQCYL